MGDKPGYSVQSEVGQTCIALSGEQVDALLPKREVRVHTGTVVLEYRLGHKRRRFAVALGHVLDDVFIPHKLVSLLDQRCVKHIDFGLSAGSDFVMVFLDHNPDLLHFLDHFAADILLGVGRAYREIAAFVRGFVSEVGFFETWKQ